MDRIRIHGGARLSGAIPISGAKNAALKLMAASLLTPEPLILSNVPRLADVRAMAELLKSFGVTVAVERGANLGEGDTIRLQAAKITSVFASYDIVRKMRASFQVLAPLLARHGEAKVSLPGGCAIGARPVNLHLDALTQMGATVDLADGYVLARAKSGLHGAEIVFPSVSVGATETALMAATLAQGTTVIANAAREPEIEDLCHCLIAMGARISGLGTAQLTVEGVKTLHGAEYAVMPDRIEAGTYAIAAAIAGGEVELVGARRATIAALLERLERTGAEVRDTPRGIGLRVKGGRPVSVDLSTAPFPGFPTDLRASVSLVLAGLAAEGETIVNRVYHLDRGFDRLEEKLSGVGVDIARIPE